MTAVLFLAYVLAAIVGIGLGVLLWKFVMTALRGPGRRWVERSPRDRRRRRVPVARDRRKGPRRQEDIARQFLDGVGG